jgi:hypothetical protein
LSSFGATIRRALPPRPCRCEIFDEPDLDAALVRFQELDQPSPTQP